VRLDWGRGRALGRKEKDRTDFPTTQGREKNAGQEKRNLREEGKLG